MDYPGRSPSEWSIQFSRPIIFAVQCEKGMERDYYGAVIRSVQFGPRNELTLQFDTSPKHNSATDGIGARQVTVRFGGISNYEEVLRAFKGLNTNESLHYLKDDPASKPTRRLVDLEFDRAEQCIRIIASHVQEQAHLSRD
jgi:hypothetical protein